MIWTFRHEELRFKFIFGNAYFVQLLVNVFNFSASVAKAWLQFESASNFSMVLGFGNLDKQVVVNEVLVGFHNLILVCKYMRWLRDLNWHNFNSDL